MTPPRPTAPERGTHRLAGLDALRGLAALAIVVLHVWLYTTTSSRVREGVGDAVLHQMRLGLTLFFVLSGYLLYRGWVAAALDGREPPRLRRYASARLRRLAPGAWACLLLSVPLLIALDDVRGVGVPSPELLPLFAVFAQGLHPGTLAQLNPPMWTLTVEASFYLTLPLLGAMALCLARRVHARRALLAPVALLALAGTGWNLWLASRAGGPSAVLSSALPALAPCFAVGMAAATLAHGRSFGRAGTTILIVVGAGLVIADAWWHESGLADATIAGRVLRDAVASAGFAVLVVAAAHTRRPSRVLGSRPLRWLGERSYGVYLWHMPVIYVLRGADRFPEGRTAAALVVVLALVLPLAHLSWTLVERPALRLRLARRPRTRARAPRPALVTVSR